MSSRLIRRLWCVLIAVLAVGMIAAPASAAPLTTTTLDWRQLGLGTAVDIDGADAPISISVPVPEGMAPTVLSGVVASATVISDAFVQVTRNDGTILGTIPIPRFGADQRSIPFRLPLTRIDVSDGRADLRMILRLNDSGDVCGPDPQVSLTNLGVSYTGSAQVPSTISDVFGSVVDTVLISVPREPSAAVSQTALGLVAAVSDHYRPQRVSIDVVETSGDSAASPQNPLTRVVQIREQPGRGSITLDRPGRADATLILSGDAASLPEQVALFRDNLSGLAETTTAEVTEATEREVQGSSTTFAEFSGRLNAEVLGTTTLRPGFDPTALALGRPGQVDVHLLARYTPVNGGARGSVLAVSGGEVLQTKALNESGTLDTRFTIPAAQVAANEPLEFRISYEPVPGECNPRSVPMTFQIDPASTVSSDSTPVRMGGFASIPLGWQPTVQVALDGTDPGQLDAAAQLIASVQRSSAVALSPVLVPLDQAMNSETGALVIADAKNAQPLNPPINTADSATLVDLPSQIRVSIPEGLGTVQAFAQNSRTVVLVSTSGSWDLVDPLFTFLDEQQGELANLRGDVVVAGVAGQAELMTIRADGPKVEVEQVGMSWVVWLGISVAVLVIGVLVAVSVMLYRRRFGESHGSADASTS
ncbi:hypothetical protein [Gordonia sp. HS-NH1]|uniref:hypothetical protein n=1 Tax=Gordonia sp. HS-NH1 TaxID=1435068 RepID=UPI0006E1D47D|nr:hypothetical protein [Gordonia sp. HS-NH1]